MPDASLGRPIGADQPVAVACRVLKVARASPFADGARTGHETTADSVGALTAQSATVCESVDADELRETGWYRDPDDARQHRYWSGYDWLTQDDALEPPTQGRRTATSGDESET